MFSKIPSQYVLIASTIGAVGMGLFWMFVRMRAQKNPMNEKKILIPPVAMSTGALMFLFEEFRVEPLQILEAVGLGLLFSIVLIATSKFEVRGNDIYLKRSKLFVFILFGLLGLRVVLKFIFAETLDVGELAGMFFILAWSMIIPWRLAMVVQYRKVKRVLQATS